MAYLLRAKIAFSNVQEMTKKQGVALPCSSAFRSLANCNLPLRPKAHLQYTFDSPV